MPDNKICYHPYTTREVMGGMATGDRICNDCGALLSPAELKEAHDAARAAKKNQPPKKVSEPEGMERPE